MTQSVVVRLALEGGAQVVAQTDRVSAAVGGIDAAAARATTGTDRLAAALAKISHYGSAIVAGAGLSNLAQSLAGVADDFTRLQAQIKLSTSSTQEFARAQGDIIAIADRQRQGLLEVGLLYSKAAAAAGELGASQADIAKFAEAVSASLTIGGTSSAAAAGALQQLGQAIGGVKVQAEEFNSIIDGARPLLAAAAKHIDGAGGSVNRLKTIVNEGKLSSQEFFQAIVKASAELQATASGLPPTIGQAVTGLRNEWTLYVGALDTASGASTAVAKTISALAKNLDVLAFAAGTAAAVGIGKLAVASAAAVTAAGARIASLVAEKAATDAAAAAELSRATAQVAALTATKAAIVEERERVAAQVQSAAAARQAGLAAAQAAAAQAAASLQSATASRAALASKQAELTAELAAIQVYQARGVVMAQASAVTQALFVAEFELARATQGEAAAAAASVAARAALNAEQAKGLATTGALAALGQQQASVSTKLTAALAAQAAAQTTANAASSLGARVATAGIALLGGPIGAVVTLLGIAASAWFAFGASAKQANQQAAAETRQTYDELLQSLEKQAAKQEQLNKLRTSAGTSSAVQDAARQGGEAAAQLAELGQSIEELTNRTGRAAEMNETVRQELLRVTLMQYAGLTAAIERLAAAQATEAAASKASLLAEALDKFATKAERAQKEVDTWKKKLGDAFTPELERRIRDSLNPPNKGAESPYKAAAREIDQTVAALQRRLAAGRELTRAEELEIRLADQLADKSAKLRAGEREALAAKNAKAVAIQRDIDLAEQEARAAEAVARARADARNAESQGIDEFLAKQDAARQQELDSAKDRLRAFKAEEEAIVKSKALHVSLAEAVEMVALARLHEEQAKFREDSPQYEKLQREIDARRQLLSLMGRREARDASEKAAQEAAEAWKKVVDQAGQSLADSLMQGGRSAREYIVGLFRSLTLRPIIQAIVQPIVGAASSLLPGVANASSAAKAGDLLGSASSAANLFSLNLASSLGSVVSSAGRLFGVSALSSFGAGAQGASLAAGLAGPTTAGAAGATGLGASFAAAAPWLAGALAIFSAKDALFGRKLKDTSIEGTFGGEAGFSGSTEQFYKGGLFRSNKTVSEAIGSDVAAPLAASAKAVREQVQAYAEALALPTQAVASFIESIKFSTKGLTPDQIGAKLQEALAGYGQALAGTLTADIGPFAKAGELAGDTLARLATSLGNVNPLLSQLGLDLLGVSAAGGDAASKLVDLFGGLDKLGSSAGQFYQQFYSEQERADKASEALAATLANVGLAVPATRDAFRDLVEAQDLTSDSGRAAFAALLEVSGAFAELTPATGELADALRDAASIAQERASLEERLLALQGDTAALRERERSALDESNRALYDQIAALEAQAAAADAAAQAAAAAAQLAAQVKASVDSIVGDFVGGPELQRYRANRIAEQLGAAGIEATPDGVLGATRDDILALWRAVGDEAKLVVADLYDDWKALQIGIAQGQIDDLLRGLGVTAQDLGAALAEISPPAESLVDAWRRGRAEMQTLATALEDIAGTRAASALDTLRATVEKRDALRGVIGGNAERIFDLRVGQGGQQAVQLLRQREADLWRQFAGTSSPEVAQAITDITLQRIQLEGSLQADANAAQIDALRGQISAAERLRDLAAEMGSFVLGLQAGELSNLSATGRLGAAQQLFDASLGTGVDAQGNAQALLRQAQQTYGGASAAYSSIFEDTLAKLRGIGLGAGEQISDAQRQIDALTRVGDGSDAQIAALGDLNAAFTGQFGMLEGSIGEQTRVLREQLQALSDVVANQEAQIVQAGEAYQRMVRALEVIVQGAGVSAIDLALSESTT